MIQQNGQFTQHNYPLNNGAAGPTKLRDTERVADMRYRATAERVPSWQDYTMNRADADSTTRPEYFRLPSKGGDPHFGLSASYYRLGEQRGWWKLLRLTVPGKTRGVTLVPYADVSAFIRARRDAQLANEVNP